MERDDIKEYALIERCKAGDRDAFAELVLPYRQKLYGYLIRMCGNKSQADDLFQETLLKVWQGIGTFRSGYRFSSWMFTLAHHVVIDEMRKRKAQKTVYMQNVPDQVDHNNPLQDVQDTENKKLILNVIDELPEQQRQVFLLRQHGDLTFKEIASVMDQSVNTVLSHMHYAVKKLQKTLKENNVI
jgi:RNA polymerase sigma-70 factor (ECF subfamily)